MRTTTATLPQNALIWIVVAALSHVEERHERAHMAHRHYGLRKTKPPATVGGPLPSDAWRTRTAHSMTIRGPDSPGSTPRSGRAYGVSKTVTDAVNTTASAPRTTGQGSPAPAGAPSGTAR